ncbi:MAG TPA: hypothetical protein VNZ48_04555 [Xanthobacteraceae bacterium]|jgi:hypothetical protein|nr:hypothetical protein [Xanthobacteraceae bacterium]
MAKNARDVRPVSKYGWIVLAVFLGLAAGCGDAAAQGDAGICTIAKTCSEAFFQCVYTRCPAVQSAGCTASCKSQFEFCQRTGKFGGRDCRGKTLIRK